MSAGARRTALAVLLAGGFLPPVDFFIINVALPSIHESLGASAAELQLVISGYAGAYAVFLITGGRLGDLYGRRRMFLAGMAVFTLSTLMCGVAVTPAWLLAGRVVQGLASAMIVPQVLASLRALYAEERALARAMSAYGIMMGMAAAIGQFAGGALVQWSPFGLGWRSVFLLKLPVCLATLGAAWIVLPETSGRQSVRLDSGGAVLSALTLAAIVLPLSKGRDLGWPLWIFAVLGMAPLLAAWFLWYEDRLSRRGGMPLVDVGLLAIPSFSRGVLVGTLFFFTTAFYFLFGIYEQEGLGVAPLQTGLAIVPYGVGLFLGPIATAHLVRLRPKLLAIGMAIQGGRLPADRRARLVGRGWLAAGGRRVPRRLRPGHRISPAVQHGPGRRAAASGRGRRGHSELGLAGRRRHQRGRGRQPVLLGSGRRPWRAGLRAGLRPRPVDDDGGLVRGHADCYSAAEGPRSGTGTITDRPSPVPADTAGWLSLADPRLRL